MNFGDCVSNRRSVRRYKADKIDRAVLERVIHTASYAPSWKNTQTTRYIVIEDNDLKNEIALNCVMGFAGNREIIRSAPALILVTTITGRSGFERDGSFSTNKGTHWESFDSGIATQTLCLAAFNEGLATVVMGIFDESKVIGKADIPDGQRLSAMVAIGYPDEAPAMPKRKDVKDLLQFR